MFSVSPMDIWVALSSLLADALYRGCIALRSAQLPSQRQSSATPLISIPETQAQQREQLLEREQRLLRSLLQRWPWWLQGHLKLGELCLHQGELLLAYGCAQCALALAKESKSQVRAKFLLARCYTKSRRPELAQKELQQLVENDSFGAAIGLLRLEVPIAEERAACAIAGGNLPAALELLSKFPASRLSSEAQSALEYVRRKVTAGQ